MGMGGLTVPFALLDPEASFQFFPGSGNILTDFLEEGGGEI